MDDDEGMDAGDDEEEEDDDSVMNDEVCYTSRVCSNCI